MLMLRGRIPQGLKPGLFCVLNGTAEAVPFPKQVLPLFRQQLLALPRNRFLVLRSKRFRLVSRFLSFASLLFLLALCSMPCAAQSSSNGGSMDSTPKADVIFEHGNVYTGVPANANFSAIVREEAIAVRGDRIQAVGKNADMEKLKGPQTHVVDLDGHFVMPGFNDAHLHLDDAGATKLSVDLTGVKSLDDFRDRILKKVETAKPGDWILGSGWDETLWPVKVPPTRWDVDEVSSGHPVFLVRIDGHIAVANTRALQLGSITLASRDPQGGHIDRNESGEPTGVLRETAQGAVLAVVPKPNHSQRRQGLELALADLAEHGVTSCQDYSPTWEAFQIFEELEKEGKLTARVSEWLPFDEPVESLTKKRDSHPQSDLMLRTGMLKGFMDGSLGSHTAAMLEPYDDDPI